MKIQVLGSGCDKCKKLMANAEEAVKTLGIECECEKVTDINKITEMGVMMTPALALDGKVLSTGKVLSASEISELLKKNGIATSEVKSASEEKRERTCGCSCGKAGKEENSCCGGSGGSGKKILTFVLLGIVAVSVFAVIVKEIRSSKTQPAAVKSSEADAIPVKESVTNEVSNSSTENIKTVPAEGNAVVVYYFHGNMRCFTCNKIEKQAKAAIDGKFGKELASGAVVFKSVNVDETENQHFIKDFELASRCVVVQRGEKLERLEKVWTLVGNESEFTKYIQQCVEKMLAEKK